MPTARDGTDLVNRLRNEGIFMSARVRSALRNGNFQTALKRSLPQEDYRATRAIVNALKREGGVPNVKLLIADGGLNSIQNEFAKRNLVPPHTRG